MEQNFTERGEKTNVYTQVSRSIGELLYRLIKSKDSQEKLYGLYGGFPPPSFPGYDGLVKGSRTPRSDRRAGRRKRTRRARPGSRRRRRKGEGGTTRLPPSGLQAGKPRHTQSARAKTARRWRKSLDTTEAVPLQDRTTPL